MSFNVRWQRWISASVAKFFFDNSQGLEVYFEGTPRNTQRKPDFIEWRMDGVDWVQKSKDEFVGDLLVNVLIQHIATDDFHAIKDMMGKVQAIFLISQIAIYKLGPDKALDDGSLVGCLQRTNEAAKSHHYGFVEPDVTREQATVAAKYTILL